jgi:hypothetical protein
MSSRVRANKKDNKVEQPEVPKTATTLLDPTPPQTASTEDEKVSRGDGMRILLKYGAFSIYYCR